MYKRQKQYKPDFYISQLENYNYIEHFGVDDKFRNSMYDKEHLKNYLNNMMLKRNYHNSQDNYKLFIVTYSKSQDGKSYLEQLKEQLNNIGEKPFRAEQIFKWLY